MLIRTSFRRSHPRQRGPKRDTTPKAARDLELFERLRAFGERQGEALPLKTYVDRAIQARLVDQDSVAHIAFRKWIEQQFKRAWRIPTPDAPLGALISIQTLTGEQYWLPYALATCVQEQSHYDLLILNGRRSMRKARVAFDVGGRRWGAAWQRLPPEDLVFSDDDAE